jgi:small subunit ribosomal protein S20
MANHPSALKRARQNERRRERNRAQRSQLRRQIRELREAITSKNPEQVEQLLRPTLRLIDRMSTKGVLHGNAASRTKSRLSSQAHKLARKK